MPDQQTMLSPQMEYVNPFRVMTVMNRAAEIERQGHKVVHMEVGEPDFPTALPIVNEAKNALDRGAGCTTVGGVAPGLMGNNAPGELEYFSQ